MLFSLHIQNIALIDDVEIEFQKGLNVLTGETGAGKSILIGAINLLLGVRANKELIRQGEDRARVSGLFFVENPSVLHSLSELGYELEEDGSLTLSRQLLKDGKNLCRISGRPVTLSELREVGKLLVNIHGQHDNQALLNPNSHIHFLDSFLKIDGEHALETYRTIYQNWQALLRQREAFVTDEGEKLRKIDLLTYEINEIRDADPSPGEEEELKHKRDMINHRRFLEKNAAMAFSALADAQDGADARQNLSVAWQAIAEIANLDAEMEVFAQRLELLQEEIDGIARHLRNYFEALAEENLPIEEIEGRLDVIYRLKRKYGTTVEDVLNHLKSAEEELLALENAEANREQLEQDIKKAADQAETAAETISLLRQKAAKTICSQINENLHFLNMPEADFNIELMPCDLYSHGAEKVLFSIRTNPGEEHRPLEKIVSGGELSRMMLAIQSVLTDGDHVNTLIFDEIDTGVSGSAAQKIGRKMRELACEKQVLCVTHLAQIAAMANTHYLIDKTTEKGRAKTCVTPLSHESSVRELARIISGDAVTETTLKQAEELIEFANGTDT